MEAGKMKSKFIAIYFRGGNNTAFRKNYFATLLFVHKYLFDI